MPQLKSLALTFASLVTSIVGGSFSAVLAQATATGSVTVYQPATATTPEILYSISGQVSTPSGTQFDPSRPLLIAPGPLTFEPTNTVQVPSSLAIATGDVIAAPITTINQQIANTLNNLVLPNDLAEIVSIIRASGSIPDNYQQAVASGAVTYSNGSLLETISGEIALQSGYFGKHFYIDQATGNKVLIPLPQDNSYEQYLYIEPSFGRPGFDPNAPNYPIGDGIISSLVISPGEPTASPVPNTINIAAAAKLGQASDLEQQVSIIRAGQALFNNGSPNQSRASGSTTLVVTDPNSSAFGFTQSISGEVSLPNGLFFNGAKAQSTVPTPGNIGVCDAGQGCLFIASIANNLLATGVPQLQQLIIDPGEVNQNPAESLNFNARATTILDSPALDLQAFVSLLRAGTGANGPYDDTLQARASGSVTIATPNGTTQSVSGELSLSPGLYFERPALDADCRNAAGGCLAVTADIQLANSVAVDFADTAFINQLQVDPGNVQPGDPLALTGLPPLNFNASAARALYDAIDGGRPLEDIVSRIRAGAGPDGLVSANQPTTRAAGSVALTLPNGAVQTTTGEISLPAGLAFAGSTTTGCLTGGCLTVNPNLTNIYLGNGGSDPNLLTSAFLNVDPGQASGAFKPWNFDAAAAYGLTQQTTLEGQTSVIRAVAGDKGLSE